MADLPPNVTIQLVRTRDGGYRATAEASDWPERVVLSAETTAAVVSELEARTNPSPNFNRKISPRFADLPDMNGWPL